MTNSKTKLTFDQQDLSRFIHIVKTGSREEVRQAKKQIESFWHNFFLKHRQKGAEAFTQFLEEIKSFDDIMDADHQADFVSALKWAFWAIGDEYFEVWVEFILKCIVHPSGKVRMQTIHTAQVLALGLSVKKSSLSDSHKPEAMTDEQWRLLNLIKFGLYTFSVEQLMRKYDQPKLRRYKYVSSLPVSEFKSLQKLVTEAILRSEYYSEIYDWFLMFFEGRVRQIYSGHYPTDLKFLLSSITKDDFDVLGLIEKHT